MSLINSTTYDELFRQIENTEELRGELTAADSVAAMCDAVGRHLSSYASMVDQLADQCAALHGSDDSRVLEHLRSILTAIPYGEVYARPMPGSDVWVWASDREAEPQFWQALDSSPAGTEQPAVSTLDAANAIYVRVLGELVEPTPEELRQIWAQIYTAVEAEAAVWTSTRAEAIAEEVLDAYYTELANQPDETLEDVLSALDELIQALEVRVLRK